MLKLEDLKLAAKAIALSAAGVATITAWAYLSLWAGLQL